MPPRRSNRIRKRKVIYDPSGIKEEDNKHVLKLTEKSKLETRCEALEIELRKAKEKISIQRKKLREKKEDGSFYEDYYKILYEDEQKRRKELEQLLKEQSQGILRLVNVSGFYFVKGSMALL